MHHSLSCIPHRTILSAYTVSPLTGLIHVSTPGPQRTPGNEWLDYTDQALLGQQSLLHQRRVATVRKLEFLRGGCPRPPPNNCRSLPLPSGVVLAPGPASWSGYGSSFPCCWEGRLLRPRDCVSMCVWVCVGSSPKTLQVGGPAPQKRAQMPGSPKQETSPYPGKEMFPWTSFPGALGEATCGLHPPGSRCY